MLLSAMLMRRDQATAEEEEEDEEEDVQTHNLAPEPDELVYGDGYGDGGYGDDMDEDYGE